MEHESWKHIMSRTGKCDVLKSVVLRGKNPSTDSMLDGFPAENTFTST